MRLRDLLAKRAKITKDLRQLIEKPEGDGGDLSADQAERFDELKAELETTELSIERAEAVEASERRMTGRPVEGASRDTFEAESREFSIVRAMAGAAGLSVDWSREREVGEELSRRTGRSFEGVAVPLSVFQRPVQPYEQRVVSSAGSGSNLISTDLYGNQFIDVLRANLVTRQLGATVLSGLTGNADIPRLTTSSTVEWVADNAAANDSDMAFDKVSLTPKRAIAITEFSRNMLLQSSPDIEQLARQDFARILAEELDRVALRGGGAGEPTGILANANISDVDLGAGPTWLGVLSLISAVEEAESMGTGFVMGPTVKRDLMSTPKQSAGVEGSFIMSSPNELAGYPARSTTLATELGSPADRALIFGRWSDLLLGFWEALDILVNPYETTAYSKGNVKIRGIMTCDVELRHPESFAAAQDVGPA